MQLHSQTELQLEHFIWCWWRCLNSLLALLWTSCKALIRTHFKLYRLYSFNCSSFCHDKGPERGHGPDYGSKWALSTKPWHSMTKKKKKGWCFLKRRLFSVTFLKVVCDTCSDASVSDVWLVLQTQELSHLSLLKLQPHYFTPTHFILL